MTMGPAVRVALQVFAGSSGYRFQSNSEYVLGGETCFMDLPTPHLVFEVLRPANKGGSIMIHAIPS